MSISCPPQTGAHQPGPAEAGEVAGEEFPGPAELLALGIHVVHELVDQRDGDLLDLALGVWHLANEDVPGDVDSAFGFGVEHIYPVHSLPRGCDSASEFDDLLLRQARQARRTELAALKPIGPVC